MIVVSTNFAMITNIKNRHKRQAELKINNWQRYKSNKNSFIMQSVV